MRSMEWAPDFVGPNAFVEQQSFNKLKSSNSCWSFSDTIIFKFTSSMMSRLSEIASKLVVLVDSPHHKKRHIDYSTTSTSSMAFSSVVGVRRVMMAS